MLWNWDIILLIFQIGGLWNYNVVQYHRTFMLLDIGAMVGLWSNLPNLHEHNFSFCMTQLN